MKIKDLKVGDVFKMMGLNMNCKPVKVKCKLVSHNGMNQYVILSGGISILVNGEEDIIK
jgi:hypothetical protein